MSEVQKTIKCSIVVRALNEGRYVRELFAVLKNQKCSFAFEIILVDSGSTDDTVKIAVEGDVDKILHIKKEDFTYGRALNRGIAAAEGEVIVALSAHCIPTAEDWLVNLLKPFNNSGLAYAYGRQIGIDEKRPNHPSTRYSERRIFEKVFPLISSRRLNEPMMNNANSAFLKSWWERVEFCEDLPGLEDLDFARKIHQLGAVGAYVSDAVVYHLHDETNFKVFKRFFREEVAAIKILKMRRKPRLQIFFDFVRDYASDLAHVAAYRESYSRYFITITGYRFAQQYAIYLAHYGAPSRVLLDRLHNWILSVLTKGRSTMASLRSSREYQGLWI